MRKYVVPIVALAGIALLSPRADAANLIIKSRAGKQGRPVSLPVSVTGVTGSTQLWGLDFALTYDTTKVSQGNDATFNAAFTPQAVTGSTEVPVVVSGTVFVGTPAASNPNLYVGIVRGTSAFTTTANADGVPTSAIGLLRMQVAAGAVNGTVVNLAVPATYNVANTGDGSTTNARNGATGATSTATAGDPVVAEPITVLDNAPNAATVKTYLVVPLHKIAIGPPADVNGNGTAYDPADIGRTAAAIAGKALGTWADYGKIAADISPLNGYVPGTNLGGTAGLSYGNGQVDVTDLGMMAAKYVGKAAAANAPQPE